MSTKHKSPDGSSKRSDGEIATEIVERIGYGPRTGESSRQWLSQAEHLSKQAEPQIGKKGVGKAWMQAITDLGYTEIEDNSHFSDKTASMIILALSGSPERARKLKDEFAKSSLKTLTEAQEFALLRGILNQRDINASLKAAKAMHEETIGASEVLLGNLSEFMSAAEKIRARTHEKLEKSD